MPVFTLQLILVVDSEKSHRANRRAVYELADRFRDLAAIRAGRMRSFGGTFVTLQSISLKEYLPDSECTLLINFCCHA